MKNPNSKLSLLTIHYSLLITLILLLLSSCNRTNNPNVGQNLSLSPDSLWTPTGDAKLDSLLQLAATAPRDTNLAELYYGIGDLYFLSLGDCEKSKEYFFKLKELSEELHWNKGFYIFVDNFSTILINEGLRDSAIVIRQEALELAKKEKNEPRIASILQDLGSCYIYKGCYETALEYSYQALSIAEKLDFKYGIACSYDNIGWCYKEMFVYDRSISYYEKALLICDEDPNHTNRAIVLNNYSCVLRNVYEFEKAENCLLEAQRIFELHNADYALIDIYVNLSDLRRMQNDWDMDEKYCDKAMELILKVNDMESYCVVTSGYATIAMCKGNFNKSEKHIREALKTAVEYDIPKEIVDCYNHLSDLAIAKHDFINSRLYRAKADSLQNELVSEEIRLNAQELETKYETEKKELEIERQKSIIEKQNLQRVLLVGGIAVSALILALLLFLLRLRTRHNRELAEINLTKDKFFNIISHDLKNPAIAQRDTLKLLAKNVRTWDTDKIADYLGEMLKSSESEVELIFNLLSWAQLQTGRIVCTPETFPLSNFISGFSLIGKMAETKNVTFDIQIPDSEIIVGDKHILTTVIRNLLTNAVKFTDTGGTVTLDIAPAKGETYFAPTGYIISVSDTGIGMTAEELQNIFRIDSRHTRRGTAGESGTGLGLIVCREMLETHGSKLHVESIEGKGSRFWFEISSE